MTTAPAKDRRVQRTRKILREALLALMYEDGWDAVTVQTICDRANVGRSTFYTHFADKEELLLSGFDDLKRALSNLPAMSGKGLSFAKPLIEHADENRRIFRALLGKKSGEVVQRRFRELVVELTSAELTRMELGGAQHDSVAHYLAGAFTDLLIWSLDHMRPFDAAALERTFQQLTAGALSRVPRLA